MTKEFCEKGTDDEPGCQSNCDQPRPGKKASEQNIIIGYYEAWRHDSNCQGMGLKDIPVNSLTHLFFSFGYITPGDFKIAGMDGLPDKLFSDFTSLKKKNPGLKTVIALGGWTFNDPGPTQKVFSNMVSTKENRAKFIDNLFSFMRQYAFDGVDFDWEYPGADDRGGIPGDGKNFVKFLKELNDVNKKQPMHYSVSFTAPSSYWYLRHFDLKAVDYVDFVNMMTYDLHGVWDRDNPIGSHIYGHSNITEMRLALDLLWRNDVPAHKVNMGLGFYGRSFQLQDPACDKPGCVFKGGAAKGACSGESGILTYREIMAMIKTDKLKPFHDKTAGVKYITYSGDQWVSYDHTVSLLGLEGANCSQDDAETFKQKKELAKELGLGGYLIWAIDQDDDDLSALQAVIAPKRLGDFKDNAKDKSLYDDAYIPDCYVTGCDGNCKAGFIKITEQKCGKDDKKSKLCCPLAGAPNPDDCTWRGTAPLCNGHCNDDEVLLQLNKWGSGHHCNDGHKAYCCKSPLAQENKCYWQGIAFQTFSGTFLSDLVDIAQKIFDIIGRRTPIGLLFGDELSEVLDAIELDLMKLYCCPEEDAKKWKNCKWHGEPGSCFDNHCDANSEVQLTDSYYGAGDTCGVKLERARVFCCQPVKGEHLFLPVPLENLFKDPPTGDNIDTDFDLNLDDEDDNPSDTAFQFVVLTSPEELQVSIDKRDGSHWEVFGCKDAVTEGEHTIQMVCTDFSETSNCYKIGLGHGVPGTILQMPKGCGPGKYAVAKSMEPAKRQMVPRHLAHLGSRGVVYDLTFDYDFSRVPRDLGNTQMRVDFSNQDNYWDEVVAATPSKKRKRSLEDVGGNHVRWLEEEFRDDYHFGGLDKRELQERWFGSTVLEWLKKMVKPEIKRDFTHDVDETFTAVIVDETWECERNNVKYDGHISAKALTNMRVSTSFGFTMIVTSLIAPLDLSKSYLTFYNEGEITATLTLDAVASISYSKEKTILTLPFPGTSFRIPGIATIGPQIHISGGLDAQLSVAAKFETKISIAKWEIRQTLPDGGMDEYKPKEIGPGDPDLDRTGDFSGIQRPEFYAGVAVEGDITAKLSAAAEFGVRFDDRWKVGGATVGVVGEGSILVKMAAGISTEATCPFTYGMQVGAKLYARADASILKWPETTYDIVGWEKDIIKGGTCPNLGGLPTVQGSMPLGLPWSTEGNMTSKAHLKHSENASHHSLQKRAAVYGPKFHIPVGDLFCPKDEAGPDFPENRNDCLQIPGIWDNDKYLTDGDDYYSLTSGARASLDTRGELEKRSNTKESLLCGKLLMKSTYPTGGELPNAPIYGFEKIDCDDYSFGTPLTSRVKGIQYDTEHILEFQLPGKFLAYLNKTKGLAYDHPDPNWKNSQGKRVKVSFCTYFEALWDIDPINIGGSKSTPVAHLGGCYPTKTRYSNELVVLEHRINIPSKGKAWGRESQIVARETLKDGVEKQPDQAVKTLRELVGSALYHKDPTIAAHLKRQKERVGKMFGLIDKELSKHPRVVNNVKYTPWKPQGLEKEWDKFMKKQHILAFTKTTKPVIDWTPKLKDLWASKAARDAAEPDPNDNQMQQDEKKKKRALIKKIDALDKARSAFKQWNRPF
ncbi:chitinase 5 [Coccidioides immitis RS]|uniref:chitinase n=1 Tax=Coccidioides immitis (strain RS) TaxID=246410 RepID=J3KE63_COCIM|nr:chitinase 5 [Coccidioides immitis RS]EAS33737.3 chitinase 5 [Coccidioides immitis RS]